MVGHDSLRKNKLVNNAFPTDGTKLMKPKVDLVSMFHVSVDGRAPILVVKKRKSNEVFTSMVLVENAPMLKLTKQFSKNSLTSVS